MRSLRSLGQLARLAVQEGAETLGQAGQKRMSHYSPKMFSKETPVDRGTTWLAKNPYVEAWVWRRDHMEREFSWNKRNTFELLYFVGGITAGFYALSIFCVRHADARSGYKKRDMLGAEAGTGFVLPDEREFN